MILRCRSTNARLVSTSLLETLGPRTKAVIFVHPFGFPIDPSPMLEIANEKGIAFIDDVAQSLGASTRGKKAGSFGNVGILTFNKAFNVDHGAAVITSDEELAAEIELAREKYESRSSLASLGYRLIELIGLESAEIMRFIFRGDKYLHRLRDMMLAEEHFRSTTHWERINASVIESWRGNALTRDITDELMAFGKAYSHRRKLEKAEILSLRREFKNLEKYLRDRRKIAKMYDELLEEGGFSRIDVPANSAPSYLRYPILIFDKSRLSKCIKELACAGFHVDGRYKPLHASPSFGWINKSLRLRESVYVSEHILPLPIACAHPMGSKEVEKVASIVNLSHVHGEGW